MTRSESEELVNSYKPTCLFTEFQTYSNPAIIILRFKPYSSILRSSTLYIVVNILIVIYNQIFHHTIIRYFISY